MIDPLRIPVICGCRDDHTQWIPCNFTMVLHYVELPNSVKKPISFLAPLVFDKLRVGWLQMATTPLVAHYGRDSCGSYIDIYIHILHVYNVYIHVYIHIYIYISVDVPKYMSYLYVGWWSVVSTGELGCPRRGHQPKQRWKCYEQVPPAIDDVGGWIDPMLWYNTISILVYYWDIKWEMCFFVIVC